MKSESGRKSMLNRGKFCQNEILRYNFSLIIITVIIIIIIAVIVNTLTLKLPKVINMKLLPIIPYIIQQTGNENIQAYQVKAVIFI